MATKHTVPLDVVADGTTESSSLLENMPALTGFIWARQWQVYHIANLANSTLQEAMDLLGALSKVAARGAYDRPGKQKADALDMGEVSFVLSEVLDCIDVATECLSLLNVDIRNRMQDQET